MDIVTDGVCLKYNMLSLLAVMGDIPNEVKMEANELLSWLSKAHIVALTTPIDHVVGMYIPPTELVSGKRIKINKTVITRRPDWSLPMEGGTFENPMWTIDPKMESAIDKYLHSETGDSSKINNKV